MKKWLKRLLTLVACLLVMLIVIVAASYHMLHGEPAWYHRAPLTQEMRDQAMSSAQTKFSRIEDLATSLRAYESRREKAIRDGTTLPSSDQPKPLTVLLSEDELNAAFQSLAKMRGWDQDMAQYVTEPTLILEKDRLIFGGKLTDLKIVASAYFAPAIDPQGQLHLDMVNVLGGKLPLPDMLIDSYRTKVSGALSRRLPPLQRSAQFDKHGVPNDATVQASMTKLVLESLHNLPADSVIFLPLLNGHGTVPVRLTDLQITPGQIQMTLTPMDQSERKAMLTRLQQPVETAPAQ